MEEAPSHESSVGRVEEGSWGAGMVHKDFVLDREAEQFTDG